MLFISIPKGQVQYPKPWPRVNDKGAEIQSDDAI